MVPFRLRPLAAPDCLLAGRSGRVSGHLRTTKEKPMRVANTVELKNKTNKILKEVMKGSPVIITYRGKPAVSLTPLTEDELEDFILENSPKVKKMIAEADKDIQKGKVLSLDEYLTRVNE
jgi:prevent-host-death family protein